MLSGAGVQRSGTPAESKHPYPQNNCREQRFLAPLGMTFASGKPLSLFESPLGGHRLQSPAGEDSTHDQNNRQSYEQCQPSPVLQWMPQHTHEMPPVMTREIRNTEIACTPRRSDNDEESPLRIVTGACCSK